MPPDGKRSPGRSPIEAERRRLDLIIAYHDGLRDGVRRYAWWKDGIQYVGSGVYTLADALSTIERDQERATQPEP